MKIAKIGMLTLIVAIALLSQVVAQVASGEEAIAAIAAKWAEAWDNDDMATIAALYTEDVEVIGTDGQKASGRQAIEAYFGGLRAGPFKGTTLTLSDLEYHFVSATTCVGDNSWEVVGAPEEAQAMSKGTTTVVSVKKDGQWMITAHQSRIPVPEQ